MEDKNKFENLSNFQAEIAALQQAEMEAKKQGKPTTAHFLEWEGVKFNPNELTADDQEIWEKVKDGSLTEENFYTYQAKVLKESQDQENSRKMFMAYIANRAMEIFWRKSSRQN